MARSVVLFLPFYFASKGTQPKVRVCALPKHTYQLLPNTLCPEAEMQALQTQCACLGASTSGRFAPRVGPAKAQVRGPQPGSKRQRHAWLVQAVAGVTMRLL